MKFPREELKRVLAYFDAQGDCVATPQEGGEEAAEGLRKALYKWLSREGRRDVRIVREGEKLILEKVRVVRTQLERVG